MEFRDYKDITGRLERDESGALTQRFETRLTTREEMDIIPAAMYRLAIHAMTTEDTVGMIDAQLLCNYIAERPANPNRIIMTTDTALRFAKLLSRSGRLLLDRDDAPHAVDAATAIRGEATKRQHEQIVKSYGGQIQSMSVKDFLIDPTQE